MYKRQAQQIGDRNGIAAGETNLGLTYYEQYQDLETAIPLLIRAYNLFKEIGSPNANVPESYLITIIKQIGKERFSQIIQSNQTNSLSW